MHIGFPQSTYTFYEPQVPTNVTISLEKQDEGITEQSFLVIFEASAKTPNVNITAATISSLNDDGSVNDNDYSISALGENSVVVLFPTENQSINFTITLYPDSITEGLEAFQIERRRDFAGPPFRPPRSNAFFLSSFIIIAECKSHRYQSRVKLYISMYNF